MGRPFVSTGVTCRHQLPIRQCNIRPILPACDWEILEWSKPTNLIYRASINKEIVPSLIALLNNGCLFGNHFPISHHFPLDWPSRVLFFFLVLSFVPFSCIPSCTPWHAGVPGNSATALERFTRVAPTKLFVSLTQSIWGLSWLSVVTLIASLLRRRVLLWLKHFVFWFILLLLFKREKMSTGVNVTADSICKSWCKISRLTLKINLTSQQVHFLLQQHR